LRSRLYFLRVFDHHFTLLLLNLATEVSYPALICFRLDLELSLLFLLCAVSQLSVLNRVLQLFEFLFVGIDNLLPGWVKPAGRPARATYTMMKTNKTVRFDDLSIDGSGATVRGSVEFDSANEIVSANFPVFALSDGDKLTLKADRGTDGALRVAMRGDIYDGRNFVKSSLASADKSKQKQEDLDLDVKLGTVAGHNGETLRGLDLRLSRRGGRIRNFMMTSKIGRDTPLNGDLRVRARDNHQVIYFETDDAGSLFRFTDMYPRMFGGQMWVALDPGQLQRLVGRRAH